MRPKGQITSSVIIRWLLGKNMLRLIHKIELVYEFYESQRIFA